MTHPVPSPSPAQRRKQSRIQAALQLTSVSVIVNGLLAAVKITVGAIGHSYALVADGIESATDAVTSLIVWGGFRVALRPADATHPFGHGKAESLAGFVVALGLIATSFLIAAQGVRDILHPGPTPRWFTLPLLLVVIVVKEFMARRMGSTGDELGSQALKSDAGHHRSDMLASIAAFIGISIAILGGLNFTAADGCASLVAAVIVAINGFRLLLPAMDEVMDASQPEAILEKIRALAGEVEGVRRIEKCRIRKSGIDLHVEIHVMVDGNQTVHYGHEVAHHVKDLLIQSPYGITDVVVHIEPA